MSAVDGKANPWQSLAKLIQDGIPVATLATAIEEQGIQTFDRFGRRGTAVAGESENKYTVTYALDQLADYHAVASDHRIEREHLEVHLKNWFEGDSPLWDFGWPEDEVPDFDQILFEPPPDKVKGAVDFDAVPLLRRRRTYLTIIAGLCKKCGIDYQARGASVKISEATSFVVANSIKEGTVHTILEEMADALDSRNE
jgi:hypothetical protein